MAFINPFAASDAVLERALESAGTPITAEMTEHYMRLVGVPPAGLGLGSEGDVVRVTNTIMRTTGMLTKIDGKAVQTSFDEDRQMASTLAYKTNPSQFPTAFQWLHDLCLLVGLQRRVVSMGRATPSSLVAVQHMFAADVLRTMRIVTNPYDMTIVNVATTTSGTHFVDISAAHAANQNDWTAVLARFSAIMSSAPSGHGESEPKTTLFESGDSISMGPVTCDSIMARIQNTTADTKKYRRGVNRPNVNTRQRRAAYTVVLRGSGPAAWAPGTDVAKEEEKAAARRIHIVGRPPAVAPIKQPVVGHDALRDIVGFPIHVPAVSEETKKMIWAEKADDDYRRPHTYYRDVSIITKKTGKTVQIKNEVVPHGEPRPHISGKLETPKPKSKSKPKPKPKPKVTKPRPRPRPRPKVTKPSPTVVVPTKKRPMTSEMVAESLKRRRMVVVASDDDDDDGDGTE